jgi:hypothetical protein
LRVFQLRDRSRLDRDGQPAKQSSDCLRAIHAHSVPEGPRLTSAGLILGAAASAVLPMNLEMASLINRDLRILRFKGAKRALVRGSLTLAWRAAFLSASPPPARLCGRARPRPKNALGYRGQTGNCMGAPAP